MNNGKYELKYSRLKNLRVKNNLNQKTVANLLNISVSAYSQFEIRRVLIPIISLNALANYYNVSLDYLVELSDDITYPIIRKEIVKDITKDRLKEIRKENKLYQETLANELGMVKSVICDCEKGRKILALQPAYILCKKYNISMDWLYGKIDEPKYLK